MQSSRNVCCVISISFDLFISKQKFIFCFNWNELTCCL